MNSLLCFHWWLEPQESRWHWLTCQKHAVEDLCMSSQQSWFYLIMTDVGRKMQVLNLPPISLVHTISSQQPLEPIRFNLLLHSRYGHIISIAHSIWIKQYVLMISNIYNIQVAKYNIVWQSPYWMSIQRLDHALDLEYCLPAYQRIRPYLTDSVVEQFYSNKLNMAQTGFITISHMYQVVNYSRLIK